MSPSLLGARQLATGAALTYRMRWHEFGINSSVRG